MELNISSCSVHSSSEFCCLQEVRSMVKARKLGLAVPAVYYVEHEASTIFMEKVVGRSVKEILLAGNLAPEGASQTQSHDTCI